MTANKFKLPEKQWDKLNETARMVFNRTYSHLSNIQDGIKHPDAPRQPKEHWEATAWNVAWEVSEIVNKIVVK